MRRLPGTVRDAIIAYLSTCPNGASLAAIRAAVTEKLGNVPSSSVRSYLQLNVPEVFTRVARGRYVLRQKR